MGLFGNKEEKPAEENSDGEGEGKYQEQCSLCGKGPTDKKWGGQYFHRKCFRKIKKGAKGML